MAIALRHLEASDIEDLHALTSRMDVVRYMLLPLCTRAQSEEFLRDAMAGASGLSVVRAICECGRLVGLGGLAMLRGTEEGELWYLVAPDDWGRGIATAAAGQFLKLGFGELGLHRVWATCLPENPGSARVLEKVGMRREGLLVKNLKIHGEWKSSYLYAMLAGEWRGAGQG